MELCGIGGRWFKIKTIDKHCKLISHSFSLKNPDKTRISYVSIVRELSRGAVDREIKLPDLSTIVRDKEITPLDQLIFCSITY